MIAAENGAARQSASVIVLVIPLIIASTSSFEGE